MQQLHNKGIHDFPTQKGKGVVGAIIFHIILIAILIVTGFTTKLPLPEEEGILVNFGTDETGFGLVEPAPGSSMQSAPVVATTTPQPQEENPLLTQEFDDEAPVVEKKITKPDPEIEKKRLEAIETERIKKAALEAERVKKAQEEAERKRVEEEQKRVSDIMNRTRSALEGSKNSTTTSTGEGEAGGAGNQGVTTGSVDTRNRGEGSGAGTRGISASLIGRSALSLPVPKYDYQGEGTVVVEVTVDRDGKVTKANPGAKGINNP